jgi:hypothetical protein
MPVRGWSRSKGGDNQVYVGVSLPEWDQSTKQIIRKCVTVQAFGNSSNKSKFDSDEN